MDESRGLTVLDLDIKFGLEKYHNFPLSTLASATSLKVLSLSGFRLMPLSSHELDLQFSSLITLRLKRTALDDFVLQKLLEGSHLLEKLQLEKCAGLKILEIKGLIWLKVLEVVFPCFYTNIDKIEIDAPNLAALKLHASPLVISLADCPQYIQELDFKYIVNPSLYARLTTPQKVAFELQGKQLSTDIWFHTLLKKCPLVERLTIDSYENLDKIGSSTTLKILRSLNICLEGNKVDYAIIAPNIVDQEVACSRKVPNICLRKNFT